MPKILMYLSAHKANLKMIGSTLLLFQLLVSCTPVQDGVCFSLAEHRAETIQNPRYELSFRLSKEKNANIIAKETLSFDLTKKGPVILDAKGFEICKLSVNGKMCRINHKKEHLVIPASKIRSGSNIVEIDFIAGTQSLNRRDAFMYTLLVPDRARTLFPCFDQPNMKAVFSLSLNVPDGWTAIANSEILSQEGNDIVFKDTKPLSTYLFSFVAGEFQSVTDSTCTANGKPIIMYHRETDPNKASQCKDILRLVKQSIDWMEDYTGVNYPFDKYDFVALPDFQYGGMEHAGATIYNDKRLFLSQNPTADELYEQLSLISHETAHMWFGDLVTMSWFNDVWIKEVFANFLAAKISRPLFPELDHRLPDLRNYTAPAYKEDRTKGSNAIQRPLDNLNNAGLIYCNIIYYKSPIVMQMLEDRIGEQILRESMCEYLTSFAYANASWDALVKIISRRAGEDLEPWSRVWVKEKGMPVFTHSIKDGVLTVRQQDPFEAGNVWQEDLRYAILSADGSKEVLCLEFRGESELSVKLPFAAECVIPNIDAKGYGRFTVTDSDRLAGHYSGLDEVGRMSVLMTLFENMWHGCIDSALFNRWICSWIEAEGNPLIRASLLDYGAYAALLQGEDPLFESKLVELIRANGSDSELGLLALRNLMNLSRSHNDILMSFWREGKLSENDLTNLAYSLMIRYPSMAEDIRSEQAGRIINPDRKEAFLFISRACSAERSERDSVFERILNLEDRIPEARATKVLALLSDPLRGSEAVERIGPALNALEDVQRYGDIFFPKTWCTSLLKQQHSPEAKIAVNSFISTNSDMNPLLMNKLLQSVPK